MSKTVYAANSGCYSDYRIDAIFSSRKLAKEFMDAVKNDSYDGFNDIEEFELDPPTADLIKRGYSVWLVHMLRDGTTERVERTDNSKYYVTNTRRTQAPAYKDKGIPDILTSKVWAKTEKQAIKIVNEQRTQMIATGKWVTTKPAQFEKGSTTTAVAKLE